MELLDNRYLQLLENKEYTSAITIARFIFEARAHHTAVAIGLHVERYRIKYGRLPETLNDLVAEFVSAVPRGLFVDEPIGYEVDDTGYVVCAVAQSRIEEVKAEAYSDGCGRMMLGRDGFRRYLDGP